MTQEQFAQQMARLSQQWKSAYSTERARLIYRTVQALTVQEFSFIVDRFLGYRKEAPLVPEFADECAKLAERKWQAQKHVDAEQAANFMRENDTLGDDDRSHLFEQIKKRARGELDDAAWKCVIDSMNDIARRTG